MGNPELFGCTFREYVGTTQLVWASAVSCAGRFDPAMFDTPDGKLIARYVGRDTVTRFTYNPLRGQPLLTGFGPGYLCPIPHLAWAKAASWGVYFTGRGRYREQFTRDLGHLFEQYVGRQLRLLPGAQVMAKITYGSRTDPPQDRRLDRRTARGGAAGGSEVRDPAEPIRLSGSDPEFR